MDFIRTSCLFLWCHQALLSPRLILSVGNFSERKKHTVVWLTTLARSRANYNRAIALLGYFTEACGAASQSTGLIWIAGVRPTETTNPPQSIKVHRQTQHAKSYQSLTEIPLAHCTSGKVVGNDSRKEGVEGGDSHRRDLWTQHGSAGGNPLAESSCDCVSSGNRIFTLPWGLRVRE